MIDTGPVKVQTGPVIRVDPALAENVRAKNELKSSRWRTLGTDNRPTSWAISEGERCTSCCGAGERRCMLREGHLGLHAWRSLGGLRVFEWC